MGKAEAGKRQAWVQIPSSHVKSQVSWEAETGGSLELAGQPG